MNRFKFKMFLASILGAAAFIGGSGLTISSGWLITMAASHPPILTLTVSIVMVRFFGISRSVARYLERVVSHDAVFNRLTALRVQLFENLSHRPVSFARDLNSGSFVKIIVDDVERAQEYQLRVVLPAIAAFISVLTSALLGIWISPESLLFTVPASILLLIVLPFVIKSACSKSARRVESVEGDYSRQITSLTDGLVEATMYGYLENQVRQARSYEEEILKTERSLLKSSWYTQLATSLIIGSSILASTLIAYRLTDSQIFPAVKVTMLIFLPLVMFESITSWFPNLHTSGKLLLAQSHVEEIQNQPVDTPVEVSGPSQSPYLTLQDVRVSWDKQFMNPISFEVREGESIVIRGRSGSGKSTLALGLLNLLPHEGVIEISGSIAGSLQNGHIFNTSLRENLKVAGSELSDSELMGVLKLLELDSIGLETLIGEFGRPLSGGEAKRLGVARALLSDAQILILDEPTEHLDKALAQRIEDRILQEFSSRILIIITHSGWSHTNRSVTLTRQ